MESLSQEKQSRNPDRNVEKERKSHKMTMAFTVTLCTVAAIAVFAYIINGLINRVYDGYEVIVTNPRQDSNSVRYLPYDGMILKYSRDGASGIRANGEILWNGSYEMNNPSARTCENYVIVGDINGKEAYVYNGEDSGVVIAETLPIIQVDVARQGVAAVVLEDQDSNEIHIYNPYDTSNALLFRIPTNVGEDGYPVDIALSDDGKKLVTSFLCIGNGVTQNKVTFYNLDSVGENRINYIVGGIDMGQELCPKLDFINNDTVVIYGEQGFRLYSMQEIPDEVYRVSFDTGIKNVMSNRKYLGFILDNNQLLIYDTTGKKILEKAIDYDYDEVYFTDNEIVFRSDLACRLLRFHGEVKWDYVFNRSLSFIFPTKERNRYIFIDDVNIEQVKLTKGESE